MGYLRGMQNQDLADQFRDQAFFGNQQALKAKAIENEQSELMNPLLIAQQGLVNTGQELNNTNQGLVNQGLSLDVDKKTKLHDESIAAESAALRSKLGDEKFIQLGNEVYADHLENLKSGDPVKIARTAALLPYLGGAVGKTADRIQARDLEELQRITQQNIASGNNETQLTINRENIAAGKYKKNDPQGTTAGIYDSLYKGRIKLNEMPAVFTFAANSETDPMAKQFLLNEAAKAEALIKQRANAAKTGEIDVGAMTEMPTRDQPALYGNSTDKPKRKSLGDY